MTSSCLPAALNCRTGQSKERYCERERSIPVVVLGLIGPSRQHATVYNSKCVTVFLKGEMHKKAHQHIWLPFLQFSTVFNETLSKQLFFRGCLNETFKSELTLLFFHSFQGGTKGKNLKNQKKTEKVQPNVLMGLFMHFPF